MSKADQLGAGRFGGGVRTVSARRQAVAAATGVPTEGIAPPAELPVHRISPNPDNPRSALGDLTDLAGSLRTHGQKQAITVMNRDAYIKINPQCEADLEQDTTYVVIDGSSRLAAAREAGLATIKVMVSDEQGTTPEELLESALVANIHRQDLEELDEARALQRLLEIYGSQRSLAKRLHRSQGWISQRLALLKLSPALQSRIGEEPIDLLRAVGGKPVEQQEAALDALKAERAAKEAEGRAAKRESGQAPADGDEVDSSQDKSTGDYDVISRSAEDDPSARRSGRDVEVPRDSEEPETVPDPRTAHRAPKPRKSDSVHGPRPVPFDQPGELAMLLNTRVEGDDAFFELLELLHRKALDRDPVRLAQLASSAGEEAARRSS